MGEAMKIIIFIFMIFGSQMLMSNDSVNTTESNHLNALTPTESKKPSRDLSEVLVSEAQLQNIQRMNQFTQSLSSDEGGWSGNGGGSRDESDNIWFIGNDPIKYCISKGEDFPLEGKKILTLIESNIKKWLAFFESYDLLNKKLAQGYAHQRLNRLEFKDGKNRGLSTDFIYTNECKEARLQFLFGVENKVIKNYKKFSSEHPYGLAVRQKYDHKKYNHKGIIWIDQFTKKEKEIEHILLHELGHIFGMKHDSVPVMDEKLSQFLGKKGDFLTKFLGKIESDSWTYGFKINHPIIMSSNKGMRIRNRASGRAGHRDGRRRYGSSFCGDETFSPNLTIPKEILSSLNLNSMNCHRVTLTMTGSEQHRMRSFNSFTLKIEQSNTKYAQTIFSGVFMASAGRKERIDGPGVVTELKFDKFSNHTKRKHFFRKLTLKKSTNLLPLTGKFNLGNESFPTKISSNRGLVIEIFIPEANKWWTLKTHYNQVQ